MNAGLVIDGARAWVMKQSPREVIQEAMENLKIVHLVYESKTHPGVKTYVIEPYSWRGGDLYAYDRRDGSIKRFKPRRIMYAAVGVRHFEPQWAVEATMAEEA